MPETHHGFIASLRKDEDSFSGLTAAAVAAGVTSQEEISSWQRRGLTRNERMKRLLDLLERGAEWPGVRDDLQRLSEIAARAREVRAGLDAPATWRRLFRKLSLPLDPPVAVEEVQPPGRCNHVYRLTGKRHSYVIRYHDPIGRDFLQRHEPAHAVLVYCAAEELIRLCLGSDGVTETLFPRKPRAGAPPVDEDGGDLLDVVANRILVQRDYGQDHFLLAEYARQARPLTPGEVVAAFAQPLAALHARSRRLAVRAESLVRSDRLAKAFRKRRGLQRFPTPEDFLRWLSGPNWVTSRLTAAFAEAEGPGPILQGLLARLDLSPQAFRESCRHLWAGSAQAMAAGGCLVHLDHNPRNCFVAADGSVKVFDFDYVATADPAYDLGLALNSVIRLIVRSEASLPPEEVARLASSFLDAYRDGYQAALDDPHAAAGFTPAELDALLGRACAFAGLILGATLPEDQARSPQDPVRLSPPQLAGLLRTCERLLAALHFERLAAELEKTGESASCGGELLSETGGEINRELEQIVCLGKQAEHLPLRCAPEEVCRAWSSLAGEVLEQHRWEGQILAHSLDIPEYRPRTTFSVLPEMEEWKPVDHREPGAEHLDLQRRELHFELHAARSAAGPRPRISVLLPIHNGYRRTFRSLACLCFDLRDLLKTHRVDFHVFVNFSDDNSIYEVLRFANTLARSQRLPIVLYSAEDRRRTGAQGRQDRWWKTVALNVMLRELVREESAGDGDDHYVHFADDDIFIKPGSGVIAGNLGLLAESPGLRVVSAAYTSDESVGFSAVSSVRKRREYVETPGDDRLLNLYGGCMTSTLRRLREVLGTADGAIRFPVGENGQEFGEDSYLTVKANLAELRPHASGRLAAFAARRIVVGQQEPANVVQFARRLVRDRLWCRRSIIQSLAEAGEREPAAVDRVSDAFCALRKVSFESIAARVHDRGDPRHVIAQTWGRKIRDRLAGTESELTKYKEQKAVEWATHKTQHQVCKDVVEDPQVFQTLRRQVSQGPFGYELMRSLGAGDTELARAFPQICRRLAALDRAAIEPFLVQDRYLFHLYAIAEEALAYSSQLLAATGIDLARVEELRMVRPDRLGELWRRFPFDLGLVLRTAFPDRFGAAPAVVPESGQAGDRGADTYLCKGAHHAPRSYTAFLWRAHPSGEGERRYDELFLRYHSVIGRNQFLEDSPRRTVYLHLLGERVIREAVELAAGLAGPLPAAESAPAPHLRIVETLFPTLEAAMVNYAGPERRAPFDRLMQSLYVQESLRSQAKPLSRVILGDEQCKDLARCLGSFLGAVHGVTFGFRAYLNRVYLEGPRDPVLADEDPRRPLLQLLVGHLDQVQLFGPNDYCAWLEGGAKSPGAKVAPLLGLVRRGSGIVGIEVEKLIRQDQLALDEIWRALCTESQELHQKFGAIGHQGLYAANLLIGRRTGGEDFGRQEPTELGNVLIPAVAAAIQDVYLANHSGVAMVDPAVEAGAVLAELISARLRAAVLARAARDSALPPFDDSSLPGIVDAFRKDYLTALERHLAEATREAPEDPIAGERRFEERGMDRKQVMPRLMVRSSRVAALVLLGEYHDRREYDLAPGERSHLVHICVDLLQMGSAVKLRFR